MFKLNTLLNLKGTELVKLENEIIEIVKEVNKVEGTIKLVFPVIATTFLYNILSTVGDKDISLKMLKVALKLMAFGRTDKESIDLVINYYCINKLGFFKNELEEMIK